MSERQWGYDDPSIAVAVRYIQLSRTLSHNRWALGRWILIAIPCVCREVMCVCSSAFASLHSFAQLLPDCQGHGRAWDYGRAESQDPRTRTHHHVCSEWHHNSFCDIITTAQRGVYHVLHPVDYASSWILCTHHASAPPAEPWHLTTPGRMHMNMDG